MTTAGSTIESASAPSFSPRSRQQMKVAVVTLIGAVVLAVNMLVPASRFADYDAYLWITDRLYYFPDEAWYRFEAASHFVLLMCRIATGSTEGGVDLAYRLLGLGFVTAMALFAKREEVDWRGILALFTLYGALLAFVTLRATPAYLLVALAALQANKGQRICLLSGGAAVLFHISAVLALPPLLVALAHNRYGLFQWTRRSALPIIAGAVLYGAFFLLFQDLLNELLLSLLNIVPFLTKYLVYTSALDPASGVSQAGEGLNRTAHLAYAGLVSAFAFAFMLVKDDECRKMRAFVIVSFVIFLVTQFSPITAFRQSPFWTIPAMLIFPWRKLSPPGPVALLFVLVCAALFALTFPAVLA